MVSPPRASTTSSKDMSSFNPSGAKPFFLAILIMSLLYWSLLVFELSMPISSIVSFSSRYVVKSISEDIGVNVGPAAAIISFQKPDHHVPCCAFIAVYSPAILSNFAPLYLKSSYLPSISLSFKSN